MRFAFSVSTLRLRYGAENGFLSISVVVELGPHMLGLYRWPRVRGARAAGWTLKLAKTWTDEHSRAIKQRSLTLYPVQENQ